MKSQKLKKRKGFTLIEMVIVITIIGILSSIAVTKYSKIQENAKKNANLATAAMISISDGNTSVSPAELKQNGYIQFEPTSKSQSDGTFTVTLGESGDEVTVTIGNDVFYPKPKN